jgi:general L-amino acid transport system permease protein
VTLVALALLDHNPAHLVAFAVVLGGLTALAWFAPRKLVVLTLVYPLLGFWLLWGGSVWGPVGVAMGFGLLVLVYMVAKRFVGVVVGTGVGVVVAGIWWLGVQTSVTTVLANAMPFGMPSVGSDEFGGFLLAFVIGVTAIGASLPIGILLALGRRSDMLLIKTLCVGFIEFVRGVPLITVLFTATLLLGYFLPPQSNFDVVLRVIILVTFFSAAYLAEVIRGGLAALPKGQYEAADALGLDYWQAQRLIVMPQALKVSIPGIVSTFIGLFKDTTLVAFVGLMDPLKGVTTIVRADTAWKGIYWEPYIFVGAIFFAVCFGMSRYSMYLEKKLKTDHR